MIKKNISNGVVHKIPEDLKNLIVSNAVALSLWEDITPLARNEWICWIISAKKQETRQRRMTIMLDKFKKGERRPCCWSGCPHR